MLATNDGYFGGRPKIDEIDTILVPDNTARAQALESGDLDIILSPLSPQDVHRLAGDARFRHVHLPGIAITYLNFNDAQLRSRPTRRSGAPSPCWSTRTPWCSRSTAGIDDAATSLLIPSLQASYTAAIRQPGYDVAAAKALLASAGWKPGAGGIWMKDGHPLTFTLSTHSEDPNRVQTVEFLQNSFQAAGIDAKVSVTDWPAFISNTQTGKYDLALLGWTMLVDPDRVMFSELTTNGSLNYGHYGNPQVDALLERGRAVSDAGARAEAYQAAARILAQDVPYYVMSYQGFNSFADPKAAAFAPDARGFLRSLAAP